ncbi:Hsp70 family protein, partial [bacterium]|nr:Hsp70 family protein [bacterium]
MARTKIDYGIDLGTTNSAIVRMDEGKNRIIKSDDEQSDTTSSCVGFKKNQTCFIGLKAFNRVSDEAAKAFNQFSRSGKYKKEKNVFIEFKRSMGSDKKYESSFMEHDFSSEELSAEVLKKLKSYVRDDSEVSAVVITVPAMFQQNQIEATKRAAELAGFQYCELLQEPIAASMAYGLTAQGADGFWLVFDFGGGTFDAALMQVEDSIIKVKDTSGDNRLGGKNVDHAIVDEILIPHLESEYNLEETLESEKGRELLREALKRPAEEIKIDFSSGKDKVNYYKEDLGEDDDGEELELNITVTLETFERVVKPIFQQAVDISIEMLKRNNLSGSDLFTVLMVGGPTFLETLRSMLREQLTDKIDISIDPMTVVAKGAALFASTKDIPEGLQVRDRANIQLK